MKKLLILFPLALISALSSVAQPTENTQTGPLRFITFYPEFGTNVVVTTASISSDIQLYSTPQNRFHVYGRVGWGVGAVFLGPAGPGAKASVQMFTGRNSHHFEFGGGVMIGRDNTDVEGGLYTLPIMGLGYRFQPAKGGFLFRTFVDLSGIGLGLGWAFPVRK